MASLVSCSPLTLSGRNGVHQVSTFSEQTSASFNPQAVAVGICGTAKAVKTPGAEGIIDGIVRKRRAVAAVGVTGRIMIIGVHA